MKIKKISIIEFLVMVLMFLMLFSYSIPEMYRLLNIMAYLLGACICFIEFYLYRPNYKIYVFIFGLFFLALLNYFVVGNGSIASPIKVIFQYSPVAMFLYKKNRPSKMLWYVVALSIVILVESAWLRSPDKYILWQGISRNYISVFLILSLFFITVVFEKEERQIPMWIPIAFFVLNILGIGRGGIIAGILYLSLMIFFRLISDPNVKYRKFKLFCLVITFLLGILFVYIFSDFWLDKFTTRFIIGAVADSNNGRMRIYAAYLSNAFSSLYNLLFGVGSQTISNSLNFTIGSNLHCSYLQLHSVLGLLGLLGFIKLNYNSIRFLQLRNSYQSLCLLIVLLVRIVTDYAVYGFITDIVFLYYIYQTLMKKGNHV